MLFIQLLNARENTTIPRYAKTIKVSANNPSNQVTIISTAPYLRDNKLDPYEWKEQPLVTESQPVLLLLIVHQES